MFNKKLFIGCILTLFVALGLAGCGQPQNNQISSSETIKVGAILPLTGDAAAYGQSAKRGIELAVEKIKQEMGLQLEVVYEDDQIQPDQAAIAANKLVNVNKVKYLIGFGSGETLAICPISDSIQAILFSSGNSPDITNKCGQYTFRNYPSNIYQGKILAQKLYQNNYHSVGILYINNDYGQGLKDEFIKNFQSQVLSIESHKPGANNFQTQLIKIQAKNPQVIVLITYAPEGINILKQKQQLGITQPVFAAEGLKDGSLLEKLTATQLVNLYITFAHQYNGAEFTEYQTNYLDKYGQEYGVFSDYVYDNILTLARALEQCPDKQDTNCVKDEIYKTNFYGATGLINFDANGDIINKDYDLYTVKDGEFVMVE